MKCPVCKTECHNDSVCPECGFADLAPVFLSKEDGEEWHRNVVLPWRTEYWETLDDFEIEGAEITNYYGCASVVVIPYGIERIGDDAFKYNKSIKEIYFPETLKSIGDSAFYASALTTIVFSSGLERIEDNAFEFAEILSIWIPPTCKSVGADAFSGCHKLKTVHLSNGVEQIEDHAFAWCSNVESIIVPASVSSIGVGALSTGSPHLSFSVDPRNEVFGVIGKCLVEKEKGRIVSGSLSNEIPSDADIRIIGEDAFQSCKCGSGILNIPPNITEIEDGAFCACAITAAYIPRTVKVLGRSVFYLVENCAIYCEHKREPAQWHSDWCNAKKYNVTWGQRWKINYGRPELILLDKGKYCATLISYSYDEDESQMKMFIRLINRSDMQVRFVIAGLSIDDDTSTVTHWCTVDPNSETRCEYKFNDSEFDLMYLSESEEITFEIEVKDDDDQYVFAKSELIALPGFCDSDEDEDEDKDEDGGELPF